MKGTDSALRTQHSAPIPPWCQWGRGDTPIFFVAPHGGRRARVDATAPPARLRVNDVHTPEITRLLAGALDAGFMINVGMDRNVLDLNRISQVRKQAPWFLELLTQEIARVIGRHGRVELIFVHGWNTGQATCDIGIGAIETPSGLQVPAGAHVTVNEPYRRQRIGSLRAACRRAGIQAPLGERYPGSHCNNLLQLFTPLAAQIDHPCAQRIGIWVAEGRINALQLELGIPLRWPGRWRDKFVAALVAAFADAAALQPEAPDINLATQDPGLSTREAALQFYDANAGIGMFAGMAQTGPRVTSGRALLFLGGQRVALFTGEEVHAARYGVGPLRLSRRGNAMRLEFAGPMLWLDDAALYLDLEAALTQSQLVDAEVQVEFAPTCTPTAGVTAQFGALHGFIAINGDRREVDAGAFANAAAFRAAGARSQTMLAAAFDNQRGVLSRAVDGTPDATGIHFTRRTAETLRGVRIAVTTDGDAYTPREFELTCAGLPAMRGQVLSRMPILRPHGAAGYVRVTFGIARFEWNSATGYGLYEHARPVGQPVTSK
jgi:hypothetical protein